MPFYDPLEEYPTPSWSTQQARAQQRFLHVKLVTFSSLAEKTEGTPIL